MLGGLTFASPGNNAVFQNTSHLFSPRVGLAWSPERLHGKTVIRAGFGMFAIAGDDLLSGPRRQVFHQPAHPTGQEGFSQSTALTATANNYALVRRNGYVEQSVPDRLPASRRIERRPADLSPDRRSQFLNPQVKNRYSLRWDFDIQQTLAYEPDAGSRSTSATMPCTCRST